MYSGGESREVGDKNIKYKKRYKFKVKFLELLIFIIFFLNDNCFILGD